MSSLTRLAATYWAIMKPEFRPPSSVRNGGRPFERAGFSMRSMRRSLI